MEYLNDLSATWGPSVMKQSPLQYILQLAVNWQDTPGRDEAWKKETIRNTSEQQFRVEYGCEFLGSSNTLIDPTKLQCLSYKFIAKVGQLWNFLVVI